MSAHFTVELNPVNRGPVSFNQLLLLDVVRLQSPDAPGPHRPAFFCRDNKVFATAFPKHKTPGTVYKQPPSALYASGSSIVAKSIYTQIPASFSNDVEIPLRELPKGGVYSVNATFGDLVSSNGARLLVDSGSSTTWVYGENLLEMDEPTRGNSEADNERPDTDSGDGTWARLGHRLYRPERGARALGRSFQVAYKDHSRVAGDAYQDKLILLRGGNTPAAATPPINLTFGVATTANREMLKLSSVDGVLGLGYARTDVFGSWGTSSFLESIGEQYALDGPYFLLKLRDQRGTLTFGPPPIPLTFEWEKVINTRLSWDLYSPAIETRLDGQGWIKYDLGKNNIARLDCGCTLCYLHPLLLEKIYGPLRGVLNDGVWYIPKTASQCQINVKLGKKWIKLPSTFLHNQYHNNFYDYGTFQIRTGDVDVYGAHFFRCIDTYFYADAAEPKIGFVRPS